MEQDKSILQKNLEALEKFRPTIYKKMDLEMQEKTFVEIERAKNGQPILKINSGGKEIYLNSRYSPENEAKIWAQKCKISNVNQISIIFGMGNGIFIEALWKRIPKENAIIVYEPCIEVFYQVIKEIDMVQLLEKVNVQICIEGINEERLREMMFNQINITNYYNQNCFSLPRYIELFEQKYIEFIKKIKEIEETAFVKQLTIVTLGTQSEKNKLQNMKYFINSKSIRDAKETKPENLCAIIVAAGPSLNDEFETLKKAKGKVLIVAVERIVDVLLEHGIIPDMIASVDPIKEAPVSKKFGEENMAFLSILPCNPKIYDKHRGVKFICNDGSMYQNICENVGVTEKPVPVGGSVATFAFSAMIELGMKKIILVGQDLSYRDGKSHAGKMQEGDPWGLRIEAEGVDGTMVVTRQDWRMFAKNLEDVIAENPEIEYIDTKRSGLKIKGTKIMPLEEALREYAPEQQPIQKWIDNAADIFSNKQKKEVMKVLERYIEELKECSNMSRRAIKLCEKLEIEQTEKNVEKLQKITENMRKKQVMVLVNNIMYGYTGEMQGKITNLESETEVWSSTKRVFEMTIDMGKVMRKEIRRAIKEVSKCIGDENIVKTK